jgi:hypothetical protein
MPEPILIKITPRHNRDVPSKENPRAEFWRLLREGNSSDSDTPIQILEGRLCREFGDALKNAVVNNFRTALRSVEFDFYRDPLFKSLQRSERLDTLSTDLLSKYIDLIQQTYKEIPALRDTQEKIVAANNLVFAVRIHSYSSLNLDVVTGPLEAINKVFDANFDTFRVFLDAFVPIAFASVFDKDFADQQDFQIVIPDSLRKELDNTPVKEEVLQPLKGEGRQRLLSLERAEYLWRLANGSLLLPVILGLVVMLYAIWELSSLRRTQNEVLQPILDHYLKMLQEDRERLILAQVSPTPTPSPQPTPTPSATPTPNKATKIASSGRQRRGYRHRRK